MSTHLKITLFRARTNFNKLPDVDIVARATAVINGMAGNPAYPKPPVDLTALATTVAAYSAAIAAALDGARNVKDTRNKLRKLVIKDLRFLAVYVENNCNDDAATFSSSGFVAASNVRTVPGPAAIPFIRKLNFGSASGQFQIYIRAAIGARTYNLRYAEMTGATPGTWIVVQVATVRKAVTIANLTPAATYAFQVQALGAEGLSDWSDSVTSMCI